MRDAIRVRYTLLPYFYSLFREANVTGVPVVRPLWMEFPSDEATFSNDEAFMVGNSLLVQGIFSEVLLLTGSLTFYLFCFLFSLLLFLSSCPVNNWSIIIFLLIQRAKHASVYLPGKELWYDFRTGSAYKGGKIHKLEVSEESIPAFQRAGTILPRKDRFRRSSTQMVHDPYTLVCNWYFLALPVFSWLYLTVGVK